MKLTSNVLGVLGLICFGLLLVFGYTHAQALEDWLKLRNYQPPAVVSSLAVEDTMTPLGTHILYVNHPVIEASATTFRQACAIAEQTIVLGCYHSNQAGIEVYDVKDSRLKGVEEVTAAHEMLHAAYDRLSNNDQRSINKQLQDFFDNDLVDQRIKDTIESYKKTEPNDVVNEMHSVFGTEVANLPAPLENYYKKYFVNRAAVVAYANNYEGEFTLRTDQINVDDAQLSSMKARIQADEQSLSSQLTALQADKGRIESSGTDSEVAQYNSRVSAYNAGVRQLQRDIAAYNALVDQRNTIAAELRSLQGSLDTRLTAQPAQ